ncbi:MAG: nuclear transport factor 2 family protein [Acidobacteriota bacterium]|nr:nuclear transport factor 2 family protein [Acidobacteriota bacterium]
MEPAPELIDLVERALSNYVSGDANAVVDMISRQPGTVVIGFDANEWWEGFDAISALMRVQMQETQDLVKWDLAIERAVAWKEGTVGWVSLQVRNTDVDRVWTRFTFVFHLEGAFWRVVQWHTSLPTPNEDALGVELTTSLDEILLLVKDSALEMTAAAADGSVTIMFTDIQGSTSMMESLGEPRWLELLGWHDAVVKQQAAVFGGTVVKSQGDGFMLAFSAAGPAAACAASIQRALSPGWNGVPVPVRIGLHGGNVTAEGGDFFGRTVVVAARVGGAAAGGEILVSQATQEALGAAFAFDAARALTLKGLAGQFAVFPLRWR